MARRGGGGVAGVRQRRADCTARGPLTERRYKTGLALRGREAGGGGYKALCLPAGILSLNHGRDVKHQRQQGWWGDVRPPDPRFHPSVSGSRASSLQRLHSGRRRRGSQAVRALWSGSAAAKRLQTATVGNRERKRKKKVSFLLDFYLTLFHTSAIFSSKRQFRHVLGSKAARLKMPLDLALARTYTRAHAHIKETRSLFSSVLHPEASSYF